MQQNLTGDPPDRHRTITRRVAGSLCIGLMIGFPRNEETLRLECLYNFLEGIHYVPWWLPQVTAAYRIAQSDNDIPMTAIRPFQHACVSPLFFSLVMRRPSHLRHRFNPMLPIRTKPALPHALTVAVP